MSILLGVCIIVAQIPATIILPVIVGKVVWETLDRWLPLAPCGVSNQAWRTAN